MEVIFHVRNFGKIKSADINISNFALFVGNNNSGKTLLMELIYSVLDALKWRGSHVGRLWRERPWLTAHDLFAKENSCLWFKAEDVERVCDIWNEGLQRDIKEIIQSAFNSTTLSVEKVWLEVKDVDCEYQVSNCADRIDNEIVITKYSEGHIVEGVQIPADLDMALDLIIDDMLGNIYSLFVPSARTGFLMTYRYYFSKNNAQKGVTKPIHDFLSFLQEYSYSAQNEEQNKKMLTFLYEHMIDGQITEMGDSTFYIPKGTSNYIPLPLASSMVNELVPITKMLTNYESYDYLFLDEVETSMHPSKQIEMVRLLNRLNNRGMKMIVSTHSDTMATKFNNLLLLKHDPRPFGEIQAALQRKGIDLEQEDLLKGDIHVYQFTNGDDGLSTVEELEFRETPCTGYDFPLFNDSATSLYEEAKTVMGLDQ